MPPADKPHRRAMWVAALINPLPALGVALEIRPAVLQASSKRYTLHPTPYTRTSKSQALNPKPSILNQPYTLHPTPST